MESGKEILAVMIGAGFQMGLLADPLKSTSNIIPEIITHSEGFHATRLIASKLSPQNQSLNFVWQNKISIINRLSDSEISLIFNLYCNTKLGNFISYYADVFCSSPRNTFWVLLGLELKQAVTVIYKKADFRFQPEPSARIQAAVAKFSQVNWISFNYDLILEEFLTSISTEWSYSFADELILHGYKQSKNRVIKPHGSINVVFETKRSSEIQIRNSIYFTDESNILSTFNPEEFGYSNSKPVFIEKRPWLIGYLPDERKDEINSPVNNSDIAHDLAKSNVCSTSLALESATTILILGYSMPVEDEWVWTRFENLARTKEIKIAAKDDTDLIVDRLSLMGFERVSSWSADGLI